MKYLKWLKNILYWYFKNKNVIDDHLDLLRQKDETNNEQSAPTETTDPDKIQSDKDNNSN